MFRRQHPRPVADPVAGEVAALRAVGRAVTEAGKEVSELHGAAAALGLGPGAPGSTDPRAVAALFKRVRADPGLKRVITEVQPDQDDGYAVFTRTHVIRLLSVEALPCASSASAIRGGWSTAELEAQIAARYGTRRDGGRKRRFPGDALGLLAQLERLCETWRRWVTLVTPGGGQGGSETRPPWPPCRRRSGGWWGRRTPRWRSSTRPPRMNSRPAGRGGSSGTGSARPRTRARAGTAVNPHPARRSDGRAAWSFG